MPAPRPPDPAGTILVSDTFTRADSDTTMDSTESPLVLPWMPPDGFVWGISSDKAYLVSNSVGGWPDGTSSNYVTYVTSPYSNGIAIELDIAFADPTTGTYSGLLFRCSDNNNFYGFLLGDGGDLDLFKYQDGGNFDFNYVGSGYSPGTMRIELNDDTVTAKLAGATFFIATDSFNEDALFMGLLSGGPSDPANNYGNFKITSLGDVTAPIQISRSTDSTIAQVQALSNASTTHADSSVSAINGKSVTNSGKSNSQLYSISSESNIDG